MADAFFDPTAPVANDQKKPDDEYHNLAAMPYDNLNPNAPTVGGTPPPPPPDAHGAAGGLVSDKKVASGDVVGDGVQELPESDPSSIKPRVNKAKIKKLKNKLKNAKIVYWTMLGIWTICLVLFVLVYFSIFPL
ncbi:uncharacterized protein CELE_Y39E4A.1 [Caenorhabditis elegans]|uniref:Uncharacterized protein n=1 Tax=Caenorhabditis elegans TaxID=6239 RepID=O45921_CAEEL|nr:Uncharacterized protein CELE_Y39E4A.1 [Caenorhabditis elegans]CAA16326.1 Uncharacterized protein CELE_Y39E4A.1 [Caenorhabditis elegans]|eukprot:NP_499690.1 Uncharacterized protein CELE_Y39E4A.1 [Caenorhabditis elegans]